MKWLNVGLVRLPLRGLRVYPPELPEQLAQGPGAGIQRPPDPVRDVFDAFVYIDGTSPRDRATVREAIAATMVAVQLGRADRRGGRRGWVALPATCTVRLRADDFIGLFGAAGPSLPAPPPSWVLTMAYRHRRHHVTVQTAQLVAVLAGDDWPTTQLRASVRKALRAALWAQGYVT